LLVLDGEVERKENVLFSESRVYQGTVDVEEGKNGFEVGKYAFEEG